MLKSIRGLLDTMSVSLAAEDGPKNEAKEALLTVLDLHSNSTYCFACADYVYHPTLDRVVVVEEVAFEEGKATVSTSGRAFPRRAVAGESR